MALLLNLPSVLTAGRPTGEEWGRESGLQPEALNVLEKNCCQMSDFQSPAADVARGLQGTQFLLSFVDICRGWCACVFPFLRANSRWHGNIL